MAIATVFVITNISCVSNTSLSENPVSIVQVGDITFKATHLSSSELNKRHGKINNPYTGRPKGFVFDTIVFELEISSTESTLFFNLTDCQLKIEGNAESADNRMRFLSDWRPYTINAGKSAIADYFTLKQKVDKTMLPNKVTVTPEKPIKGYIVFNGMYPKGLGESSIKIPVSMANGDGGNVRIEFILTEETMQKSLFGIDKKEKEKKNQQEKPENSIFD